MRLVSVLMQKVGVEETRERKVGSGRPKKKKKKKKKKKMLMMMVVVVVGIDNSCLTPSQP